MVRVTHSPGPRKDSESPLTGWSAVVMVLSVETNTSKMVLLTNQVPWLQTVTVTLACPPGSTETGPLTWVTTRSGRLPTPIWLPARALLVSISSAWLLKASTIAPTNQIPGGEEETFTVTSLHAPAARNEPGKAPTHPSWMVIVASLDRNRSTMEPPAPAVPWLQTRTVACQGAPGVALGGEVIAATMKSGPEPTARVPPLRVLLASFSSTCTLT